jgi:hypothetical protein
MPPGARQQVPVVRPVALPDHLPIPRIHKRNRRLQYSELRKVHFVKYLYPGDENDDLMSGQREIRVGRQPHPVARILRGTGGCRLRPYRLLIHAWYATPRAAWTRCITFLSRGGIDHGSLLTCSLAGDSTARSTRLTGHPETTDREI